MPEGGGEGEEACEEGVDLFSEVGAGWISGFRPNFRSVTYAQAPRGC